MCKTLEFGIASESSGEIYQLTAIRDGNNAVFLCTCGAGSKKQKCKHRMWLLDGDASVLTTGSADDVAALSTFFEGTEIAAAHAEFNRLTLELEAIKKQLEKAVKNLGRVMSE